MLAITRRPSATTAGSRANWPSSRTIWATARVAGDPLPIAIPMSASLRASASLTPSPVMATTCPRLCSAAMMACFCCGLTRPNTVRRSSRSASSVGSSGRVRASTGSSAPGIPTARATALTVLGLSPEMTLRPTPCVRKNATVSAASSRTRSASTTRAIGRRSGGSNSGCPSAVKAELVRASRSTRLPFPAIRSACVRAPSWASSRAPASTISGAPSTQVPCSVDSTADHLRVELNGTAATRLQVEVVNT